MDNYEYYNYNRPPRKKRGGISYVIVALIGAIIGSIISSYIAPKYLYGKILPTPEIFMSQGEINPGERINITPTDEISAVTAVAKKGIGSVVGITTVQVQRELFWERDVQGVGSGVIVDSNGYILTNSHVIGDGKAKKITVLLENGDQHEGRVLWYDVALDLAVIKLNLTNMEAAELGDSDNLEVGQLAVAIGNPLGLDFQRSVTSGIISGLNRSIRLEKTVIEDLIQTDASINPGNSGGPLLNNKGQVIGINTAKIRTGEGLGFAIPINLVKPIVEEVIKQGGFKNVYIGFQGIELEIYERTYGVKLKADSGIVVLEVIQNSPAAMANLRPLDVITRIDNQKVETLASLRKILYKYKVGDTATLVINRDGKEQNVDIRFTDF